MSKLETNTIDTISGTTNLTIGSTNSSTVTFENGSVTGHMYPSFRVQPSSVQAVSANTWTKLNFNTEVWDTDSAYDTSSYRFTVPSGKAGKYFISASVGVRDGSTVNRIDTVFYLNGVQDRTFRRHHAVPDSSAQFQTQNINMAINLSVGDYLELYLLHNAGGNLDVNAQNTNLDAFWYGYRIGA